MAGNSRAVKDAAVADARQQHKDYAAESALAQLHISQEFREAEVAMARDQAALSAMQASVAEARKNHLEHEIELVRARLGLPKEYLKSNYELERNEELVALERALIETRDHYQQLSGELKLAQLRVSPQFLEVEVALAETQASLVAKIVEDAEGWVLRAETELAVTEKRLAETIGKQVLAGAALERDLELVKAAVEHGSMLLASRKERPVDRDFARWCLDIAKHRVAGEIKDAKPASNEKEQLEFVLESLNEQYAVLARNVEVSEVTYRRLITEILAKPENTVDENWLIAQLEVLAAREHTKAPRVKAPEHAHKVDFSMSR